MSFTKEGMAMLRTIASNEGMVIMNEHTPDGHWAGKSVLQAVGGDWWARQHDGRLVHTEDIIEVVKKRGRVVNYSPLMMLVDLWAR